MRGPEVSSLLAERTAALDALEIIPAAVIVRRLDGTVLWWNTGARRLYGWTSEAARGRRAHHLLGTVFESGSAAEQQAALERDGHWDGRLRHLTASGRIVTVHSRQVVRRTGDAEMVVRRTGDAEVVVRRAGDAEVLEINTDVTAARAAEMALAERIAALEAANQLKLDIIGMLGHEISNPLSAILGYSDLLADDLEADSRAAMAVTVISRQAQRLDEVVRKVLSMVSIDDDGARHEPGPAAVPSL